MNDLLLYASVFVGSAIPVLEVWIAVPLGVIAGLPWIPAAIAGFVGNLLSLLPIIYASEKVKLLINRWGNKQKKKQNPEGTSSRKHLIMEKFGVPGLAFIGPFLIGIHAAGAFAIAMGASKKIVMFWFTLSLLACSLLFGFLASLGLTQTGSGEQLPFL
ncbi:small multi-drug export protein [Oceanospirillum sanctuarii]|uniref:small multi-drug export protein n=1 Tax=Oceanospirillum sanctuarii TaxID=1434821 RepID=UPI000A3988D2|nr:small multi-drug export protein [Oceanospirillum sanctuarii]